MSDDGWTSVAPFHDVPEARLTQVDLDGQAVLLYRAGELLFAISNRCTHAGMALDRGPVRSLGDDAMVTCPAHGSRFSLRDGRVMGPPAREPLPSFDARVVEGEVQLRRRG